MNKTKPIEQTEVAMAMATIPFDIYPEVKAHCKQHKVTLRELTHAAITEAVKDASIFDTGSTYKFARHTVAIAASLHQRVKSKCSRSGITMTTLYGRALTAAMRK